MILLELALNGIRGFKQLRRLNFKSGLNLIQGNNGSGKTTLCDTLFALLSPTSSKTGFNQGQAGLLIQLRDGGTYRLARDFAKQKSSLAQLSPDKQFNPVTQDETQILTFLTDQAGGLKASELEELFTLKRSSLPSSHLPAHPKTASRPDAAAAHSDQDRPVSEKNRVQKEKRLEEIRATLAQADQLGKMEDQVADLQARSAELKRRVRIYQEKTDELERLKLQDRELGSLSLLPEDYVQLFEQYEQQQTIRNEKLLALSEDKARIQGGLDQIPSQPIFLNKLFVAGGGIVLLSFIFPLVFETSGLLRTILFLPLLIGIGLMAFAAIQDFLGINKRKSLESQLRSLAKQREAIESAFKTQTAPAQELLKKANCGSPEAFQDKARDHERNVAQQQEIETERNRILSGKTKDELGHELSTLTEKMEELESKIRAHANLPTDLYLLQEEMRKLEHELSRPMADLSQPPTELSRSGPSEPSDSSLAEPLRQMFSRHFLRSLLQTQLGPVQTEIHRWLVRFPQARSLTLILDEQLTPAISFEKGRPAQPGELSSSLLDQVYFSLFVALAQLLAKSHPFPLILDDPLGSLDSINQQIALDILREIAQNRQVLLLSNQSYPSQEGDGVMTLG